MVNHPSRRTRLDDAVEIANAVSGLGNKTMTLVTGDAAHNAEIIGRVRAAVDVLEAAAALYRDRSGDLSAPSYIRFAERRDMFREMAAALTTRASSPDYQ